MNYAATELFKFIIITTICSILLATDKVEDEHCLNEYEQEVIRLTNEYRISKGIEPLSVSKYYCKGARDWSKNMYHNGFRHAKNGCYVENIAHGQRTPQKVMNAWINSKGHRANILNRSYKKIGVGFYKNYWTQRFGK